MLAYITPAGEHGLYIIHEVQGRTDPGFGQGRPGLRPDHDLPGYGHPDHSLPGRPVHPDQGLPGMGARPDQGLPGGRPGIPNNDLPSNPPPQVAPGQTLVLVRSHDGKWHYAALPAAYPVPTPLPTPPMAPGGQPTPPHPGQLPGQTPQPRPA
jgi:hypothetical protein